MHVLLATRRLSLLSFMIFEEQCYGFHSFGRYGAGVIEMKIRTRHDLSRG